MSTHIEIETPVLDKRVGKPEQFVRSGNAVKAELRTGSNICECAQCNLMFTGIAPFDRHQIASGLRCLTPQQMEAIGMTANANGVWQLGTYKNKAKPSK